MTFNPPVKGEEFILYTVLESMTEPGELIVATIDTGDWTVYTDGSSSAADIASASGQLVGIFLETTHMDGDNIVVVGKDQTSPKQWADFWLSINPTGGAYNPPVIGVEFQIHICLEDHDNPGLILAAPSIANGDFSYVQYAGSQGTITNVPTVSGDVVKIVLTASEMNNDIVSIIGIDQTIPKQWADFELTILTTPA